MGNLPSVFLNKESKLDNVSFKSPLSSLERDELSPIPDKPRDDNEKRTILQKLIAHIQNEPASTETILELLFRIEERGSTVSTEIRAGCIHFLSVALMLAVNPEQLSTAGYNKQNVAVATALSSGVGCMLTGIICNFPFLVTPSLSTGIYLSAYIQNNHLSTAAGNTAVFVFGILVVFCSNRSVTDFLAFIIPKSIKKGVVIGLALLVTLRALIQLQLIVPDTNNVIALGNVWSSSVFIGIGTVVLIGVLLHHELKGAYVIGLISAALLSWTFIGGWPSNVLSISEIAFELDFCSLYNFDVIYCIFDLFIIATILLSGLSNGLGDLAGLSRQDGSAPRRRWLYFVCGVGTMLSAGLGSGPVILTAESAPGIVDGAKTGLSSCICGLLFFVSFFCIPLWAAIPVCANVPVVIMIGFLLFENTSSINWRDVKESLPVYITAIFCAFTCSILYGVIFGVGIYIAMNLFTSDIREYSKNIGIAACDAYVSCQNTMSSCCCFPNWNGRDKTDNEFAFSFSHFEVVDIGEQDLINIPLGNSYSSFKKSGSKLSSEDDLGENIERAIISNSTLKYSKSGLQLSLKSGLSFNISREKPQLSRFESPNF